MYRPISEVVNHPGNTSSENFNMFFRYGFISIGQINQIPYRAILKFQNDGDAPTDYVRVECYLDDKVDLNSIDNITVRSRVYQSCDADQQIQGRYVDTCGAIWELNYDTRVLTVEMHNIKLWSSMDPGLPRIDLARGQIEFDVKVRDNYIFGTPVIAHSEIYFDENKENFVQLISI